MLKLLMKLAALTAIALLPLTSHSAEVKIRYVTTVYTDDAGNIIRQPEGVACSEKSLLVADTGNGRLLRYSYQKNTLKRDLEIKAPQLTKPIRVQINAKEEILALDGKQLRIVRFNQRGELVGNLEVRDLPSPSSFIPKSLYLDKNDDIYILDIFGKRVLLLDPQGKYKSHIDFPEEFGFISDLSVDSQGNVYLIDSVKGVVLTAPKGSKAFTPLPKSAKEHMQFPVSLAIDERGIIYVVDRNESSIVVLNQDGSYQRKLLSQGWTEGLLYYPSHLCINRTGDIFIADRANNRVQIFEIIE